MTLLITETSKGSSKDFEAYKPIIDREAGKAREVKEAREAGEGRPGRPGRPERLISLL